MRTFAFYGCALTVFIATLLSACSGTQPAVQPLSPGSEHQASRTHGLSDRDSRRPPTVPSLLYGSAGNQIDIFPLTFRNEPQIGTITTGVDGAFTLYIDRNETLYVVNQGNSTVTAYPYGATSPSATYSGGLDTPAYVALDASGDLFVSNWNNGTVVEFANGSTSPTETLQTPGIGTAGLAFDQLGNLYVAYWTDVSANNGRIEEFPPGSAQGQTLGMSIHRPSGLFVDKSGNIIALGYGGRNCGGGGVWCDQVLVFPPGANYASVDIHLGRFSPVQVAMQSNEKRIFLSEAGSSVHEATYPLTEYSKFHEYQDCCEGIAVTRP